MNETGKVRPTSAPDPTGEARRASENAQSHGLGAESASSRAQPQEEVRIDDLPFAARLLAGDVRLAKTFWLYGGLLYGIAWHFLLLLLVAAEPDLDLALGVIDLIGWAFMATAVWRSAKFYEGPRIWSGLARAIVILSALTVMGVIAGVLARL